MPIRTNRGRAAVYRRLWGWPLRSPRHLVITLVGAAVVITALSIAVANLSGTRSTTASGSTPSSSAPATAPSTSGPPQPQGQPVVTAAPSSSVLPTETRLPGPPPSPTQSSATAPDPAGLDVATRWATAFTNHPDGMGTYQWLQGLRPYTTEEHMTEMESVDPARVPATRVTGPATATASSDKAMTAQVPTDRGQLILSLARTETGWRVSYHDMAA